MDFDFQNLYLAINQTLQNAVEKENLNIKIVQIFTKQKNLLYQQVQNLKQLLQTDFKIAILENGNMIQQEKNVLKKNLYSDQDLQKKFLKKNKTSSFCKKNDMKIQFRQEIVHDSQFLPITQNISVMIQKYFFKQAQLGILLIPRDQFLRDIQNKVQIKYPYFNQNIFEKLIYEIEQSLVFQTISRKFEEFQEIHFCGLHLKVLSLQSIYWILKSLQIDKMTPTQKIFFSRIKECFAYKIDVVSQNNLVEYLIENKYFYIQTQDNQQIIWIQDLKWETEDQSTFQIHDQPFYNNLVIFLNQFFDKKSQNSIWITSVESVLTKISVKKPQKFIQRAIPGGKYGCIQFIKCCGPSTLQQISFGKLAMLVQLAIDNQFLIYHKTLLIRNEQQLNHSLDESSVDRINKIHYLQQKIYSILEKNQSGVPIAILPKILQKNVNFKLDLYELGFTKLKKFLNQVPFVNINSVNTNKGKFISNLVYVQLDQQFYVKDQIYEINDFLRQLLIYNINGIIMNQVESLVQKEFNLQIQFDFTKYLNTNQLNFLQITENGNVKFIRDKKCNIEADQFYPQNQCQQSQQNYEQEVQNIKFINALLQDFEFDQENESFKKSYLQEKKIIISNSHFNQSILYDYELD